MSGLEHCPSDIKFWLQKVFDNQEVPPFDPTPECLDELKKLMVENEKVQNRILKCDKAKKKLIKLYEEAVEEMEVYTSMIHLSSETHEKIDALVSLATELNLKEPTEANFCLAVSELGNTELKVKEEKLLSDYQLGDLKRKIDQTEKRVKELQGRFDDVIEEKNSLPKLQQQIDNILKFLKDKKDNYKLKISFYQKKLEERGADESLYHRTLVEKNEEYKNVLDEIKKLETKLSNYQSLPPNESLTALKVQETDSTLKALEREVQKLLDSCSGEDDLDRTASGSWSSSTLHPSTSVEHPPSSTEDPPISSEHPSVSSDYPSVFLDVSHLSPGASLMGGSLSGLAPSPPDA